MIVAGMSSLSVVSFCYWSTGIVAGMGFPTFVADHGCVSYILIVRFERNQNVKKMRKIDIREAAEMNNFRAKKHRDTKTWIPRTRF